MTLRLSIENLDRLPDGGPMFFEVKGRGFDLGRDAYLDWTLPDPTRHISGKHCEIRFRDGGYWLHDVSTNGTFINGAPFRLDAPYLLHDSDRLSIGAYIVAVAVQGEASAPAPAIAPSAAVPEDIWGARGDAAAPDDRRAYRPRTPNSRPVEFLDFAAPIASSGPIPEAFATPAPPADDDWLSTLPPPARIVQDTAPAPVPTPRRQTPTRPAPIVAPLEIPSAPPPEARLVDPRPVDPRPVDATAPPTSPDTGPAAASASALIARIAAAAGIDERAIAERDPLALADEIGAALKITAQNLAQLLRSRAETKSLFRSSSQTMIRAADNNPLKFTAEAEEALAIIFGRPTRGYLGGRETLEQSFADIKAHQILTFGAIQGALEALFDDLAPEKIDRSVQPERGLGALVASRKAKLWDVYIERWRAKTKRSDGRLNEAFMSLFAEAYDRLQNKGG